jgi:3'-phosphoadenosine 5'-phosphosulfate sulfotransferase (PAPS reductase)/FAD synthetase
MTPTLAIADPRTLNVHGVDLHDHDIVLVNSSAGKDSQAMLTYVVELADAQGYDRSRIVVVHANLGRVEHPGTLALAEEQAQAYGLRFEVVARVEDLLDQVVTRRETLDAKADQLDADALELEFAGWTALAALANADAVAARATPAWMSSTARYCTSDQKTSQVAKLMTRLTAEHRAVGNAAPVRILNCLGLRADESAARALKTPYGRDSASNGRRTVTRWLPIFTWTEEQGWATIHASGLRYHEAYTAGMPRLSCCFCVLAGRRELVLAARMYPGLAGQYAAVEDKVGHTFKHGLSMRDIIAEATA